jgi:hypothetical protein
MEDLTDLEDELSMAGHGVPNWDMIIENPKAASIIF